MGQVGGRRERQETQQQVAQHAHHLVVPADQQESDQRQSQWCHQPAGVDAGQQPDPGRAGLQVGGDGDHVDDDHRHEQDGGHSSAVTLQRQRLQVAACHRADVGGDGLHDPEQRRDEQG